MLEKAMVVMRDEIITPVETKWRRRAGGSLSGDTEAPRCLEGLEHEPRVKFSMSDD
jgi:hypothetical protein